ncbi:hypothetical protein [Humibacter ginsenosidimutans]|uniref:Uncharacterized protein n=1 Tax=Humibacter ginsenosidimutans TaxID=2599293 RepID=A0A5B8M574_9MICO|nr:hypothetical protein [Humibacter ginsenosidimutans]QDZ14995.1 hypothetical protein FPZ11_09660 [Humibacter ginsenosidimutans]
MPETTSDTASPNRERQQLSRRTLVKGAAWAVPAVAVAATVPLAAASGTCTASVIGNPSPFPPCDTIPAGTWTVHVDRNTSKVSWVTITLPAGFSFAGGASSASVQTDSSGNADVPEITVVSVAAGSYSATVTTDCASTGALLVIPVGVRSSKVDEVWGSYEYGDASDRNIVQRSTDAAATTGGISGNNWGTTYAAVVSASGTVLYWSAHAENPTTVPASPDFANGSTVSPTELSTVTRATLVSTYSTNTTSGGASSAAVGGVAASESAIWQWYASTPTATPTVLSVTLPAGTTVSDVQAHAGYCYALTSGGVYYWPTATSGSAAITPTLIVLPSGVTGPVTQMSSYYDALPSSGPQTSYYTGVVAVVGDSGNLVVAAPGKSQPPGTFATVRTGGTGSSAVSGVKYVGAGSGGLAALTTNGDLYTYNPYSAGGVSSRSWTRRAQNVSSVSVWGYSQYFGGAYVVNGTVTEMFGLNGYTSQSVAGMNGKTITKTFSSDGSYIALASDGTVWVWFGNLDNVPSPSALSIPLTTKAADLGVWGYHNSNYFGGAYVIELPSSC